MAETKYGGICYECEKEESSRW